jgi:hypothetical protein
MNESRTVRMVNSRARIVHLVVWLVFCKVCDVVALLNEGEVSGDKFLIV